MKMTSVSGHLLNYEYEAKYRKWYACSPAQLFDLPVSKICPNESANNIKRTLEREVKPLIKDMSLDPRPDSMDFALLTLDISE